MSSSLTILMTCWAGFRAPETSSPLARSLTRSMNCLTTGSATSASSRAMRISRAVASISAAVSRPLAAQGSENLRQPVRKGLEHRTQATGRAGLRLSRHGQPMRPPRRSLSQSPSAASTGVRRGAARVLAGQRLAVAVGHVEHVDHLGAEGLDPGRTHVKPQSPSARPTRHSRPGASWARTSTTVAVSEASSTRVTLGAGAGHARGRDGPGPRGPAGPPRPAARAASGAGPPRTRAASGGSPNSGSTSNTLTAVSRPRWRWRCAPPAGARPARPAARHSRPGRSGATTVTSVPRTVGGRTARRSASASWSARSGAGAGTGSPSSTAADPPHQVGDQRGLPGVPGGRPGGQAVGDGQGVQQLEQRPAATASATCLTVTGSSRSRRVATIGQQQVHAGRPRRPAPRRRRAGRSGGRRRGRPPRRPRCGLPASPCRCRAAAPPAAAGRAGPPRGSARPRARRPRPGAGRR